MALGFSSVETKAQLIAPLPVLNNPTTGAVGIGGSPVAFGSFNFAKLYVNNVGDPAGVFSINSNNGAIGVYSQLLGTGGWAGYFLGPCFTPGAIWTASDRNLKTGIRPETEALDKIMALNPSTYTFKRDKYKSLNLPEGIQHGFLAQELETVFPELVRDIEHPEFDPETGEMRKDLRFKGVEYTSLIPVLTSAMQEQQAMIEEQTQRLEELEALVLALADKPAQRSGEESHKNTSAELFICVPNPSDDEARISYSLPANTSQAAIVIMDIQGKEMARVNITEKGVGAITVNTAELPSGVYFYNLEVNGGKVQSKKMVVAH